MFSIDLYLSPNSSEKIISVMSTVSTQDFKFITEHLHTEGVKIKGCVKIISGREAPVKDTTNLHNGK